MGVGVLVYKIVTLFNDYNMEKDVSIQNQGEIILLKGE